VLSASVARGVDMATPVTTTFGRESLVAMGTCLHLPRTKIACEVVALK
jgi:hypothetical protein